MAFDFEKLDAEREAARIDKADLFDFYHANWDKLVAHAKDMEQLAEDRRTQGPNQGRILYP